MTDLCIAHFGTTLIESAPGTDEDQASIPMTGELARTDRFLTILGMEVYIRNMYPGIGRQFIYRRGDMSDADYIEKDTFTSYTAEPLPALDVPRVGETIFRVPHRQAVEVAGTLAEEDLITPLSSLEDFVSGTADRLLFDGPDRQRYELVTSSAARHENHRVYIWTADEDLAAHKDAYAKYFNTIDAGTEDYYGEGTAHLLVRETPGITIALLTLNEGKLAPKNSFDIFKEAGYSHFRLGSPNKADVLEVATEAFPDGGGDVSFVHFNNAYLELVQV